MLLFEAHHWHWFGLVFLDLICQGNRNGLNRFLTAHRSGREARFHALVFARQALQTHTHLSLPALLGCWGCAIQVRQGLGHGHHLLAQHLTITPSNKAVDKGERVDRPGAVLFDFGLVCTKHPVAGLVHFQDDRTGWADIGLDSPQGGCEGGNCGQARLGERY